MCFSVEADVVAGAFLLPMAVVSLREVRQARELPFASLPLLFALHQLAEAVIWATYDEHAVSAPRGHVAVWVYVGFALVVAPTLFPLSGWPRSWSSAPCCRSYMRSRCPPLR